MPDRPGRDDTGKLSRTETARALTGFVPDCARLFGRLARDRSIARRHRALLWMAMAYLAMPFDLIPDFIPVIGLLDDALLVAALLRWLLRAAGREAIIRHWPGPARSLQAVLGIAGVAAPVR